MTAFLDPLAAHSASLIEILRARALEQPEGLAYTLLRNGEEEEARLTYGELDRRARALAAVLQERKAAGERALLLYPPGLEFIVAFFGCLYAEVTAVPAYPPRAARGLDRLRAIVEDARPRLALTTTSLLAQLREEAGGLTGIAGVPAIATDALDPALADGWREPRIEPGSLAFLQYTSGSTGTPKGVAVSHGNLLHNERLIERAFGQSERSVIVGWLPLYHDMGLIGNVLQPLHVGAPCILMSPLAFLQRPARWLQAISRYRGTTSGGPNFAYDLCVERVGEGERARLDLSTWTVAFNGAEPVRAETLERFARAFAPCGFRREAFFPCYGLAEATLFVTGGTVAAEPVVRSFAAAELERDGVVPAVDGEPGARPLVGCGGPSAEQRVEIVDPESGEPVAAGRIGEIWVSGPSIAGGYWGNPEATAETFGAILAGSGEGPFLRTGDLGFVDRGELFVTGRRKDLIILRGRNLYPHDIERTVEQGHPDLRPGCGAAFSLEVDGEERLAVAQEVDRRSTAEVETLAAAIRAAVAAEHGVQVHAVALLKPGGVPKTSSGKIRRRACRDGYLAGELPLVGASVLAGTAAGSAAEPPGWLGGELRGLGLAERHGLVLSWLTEHAARLLRQEPPSDRPLVELGLDSLAAAELQHRVEAELGVTLAAAGLLYGPSLAGLAEEIVARLDLPAGDEPPLEAQGPTAGEHPASPGQRAFWFLTRLAPDSAALHIAAAARVAGDLDPAALGRALEALSERHPALRTTLSAPGGEPVQTVHEHLAPDWAEEDASGWSGEALDERLAGEAARPFDLAGGPPWRVRLYTGTPGGPVLLLVMHHAFTDLRSLAVLLRDLGPLYREARGGAPAALLPLPVRYSDAVRWQRELLAGSQGERLWEYWRERLAGELPELDLPLDRPRPPVQTYRGARRLRALDAELAGAVRALGSPRGATLFMTLLAAFQTLLHRWSGQTDLLVGSPAAGRSRPELAGVVGYFVNMVVLRGDLSGDPDLAALLAEAGATVRGALSHQGFPFSLLAERLLPQRNPSRSPLFQAALVLQGAAEEEDRALGAFALGAPGTRFEAGGLALASRALEVRASQFDLTLTAAELPHGLAVSLLYNPDLFDASTADRLLGHFETLLRGAVADDRTGARRRVSELPLLTLGEEEQLRSWSGMGEELSPVAGCLHERFAARAAEAPDAVAVLCGDRLLTYGELERRANQLARWLRRAGVGPESRVGLCLERSPELVVGVLGILKAGGAYVPLDPTQPADRLAFLIEDAGVPVLVTEERLLAVLPASAARVVCLDRDAAEIARESPRPPASGALAGNAAYLIYTSGSTGRPKGVVVTHGNVARLFDATREWFAFGPDDVWTLFHSFTFDFSVWELWGPLLHGGRLVVVPYETSRSPREFLRLLKETGATVLNQTPSAFQPLLWADQAAGDDGGELALRLVIFGGEALEPQGLRPWFARHGDRRPVLVNMYGITETTVHVTYRPLAAAELDRVSGSVIGRPIPDLSLRVLDRWLRPVPVGVPGELHVGGAGLARGYHGRPDLTALRFVPDPFSPAPGRRLYRSGDLARYRADGDLEYLGRADQQVKIRGFRIEPGEIEAALKEHPEIREAAVLAVDDPEGAGKRLAAWVVAEPASPLSLDDLRPWLAERLPEYMVPALFVRLDRLPLTANGKLDRRALPAPAPVRPGSAEGYVAPRTPVERELAAVWEGVLGVERVGVHDNYFALGGDSIRSIKVVARAEERGLRLDFQNLFRFQTIAELAPAVAAAEASGSRRTAPFSLLAEEDRRRLPPGLDDAFPMTTVLAGMVYQSEASPDYEIYLTSLHLRVAFDEAALRAAAAEMVERHAVLRSSFDLGSFSRPLQLVHQTAEVPLAVADLRGLPEAEGEAGIAAWTAAELRRRFDWSRRPPVRLTVHRRSDETFQLTLSEPLLDGWSVASLLTELLERYLAQLAGAPRREPPLAATLADFAALEQETLASAETAAFWERRLAGAAPGRLPRRPAAPLPPDALPVCRLDVPVPPSLTGELLAVARSLSVPFKSVLLAAHVKVMGLLSGRQDVMTGLLENGRPEIADGERILGLFLNAVCFRLELGGGTWEDLIRRTFAAEREQAPHRRYPLSELQRARGGQPLFDTVFNFTHFHIYRELGRLPGIEVLGADASEQTYYDLTVQANLDHDTSRLRLELDYRRSAFGPGQIETVAAAYRRVLSALAAAPGEREDAAPLLSAEERHALLYEWNDTAGAAAPALGLHQVFELQATRTPDAAAAFADGEILTYRELSARANRLARHLRRLGFGPESLGGIALERSPDLLVALLAVLKAGGAFVPLDPRAPAERLAFMLEDSRVEVLLTAENLAAGLPSGGTRVICLDRDRGAFAAESEHDLGLLAAPGQLAYVIYTSGSTGMPKGVLGHHGGTLNRLQWMWETFPYEPGEVCCQKTFLSFVDSIAEIFGPLLQGVPSVLVSDDVARDPERLLAVLAARGVTRLVLVPSLLRVLLDAPGDLRSRVPRLRHWVASGESLPADLAERFAGRLPGSVLLNIYGSSEVAADVTWAPAGAAVGFSGVPVGRPLANCRVYLLDARLQPVPPGVPGQVAVGGAAVARGYLRQPALTAERFIPDPFGGEPGGRLYLMGDLGRYRADGHLELLGRIDRQVKVRGVRVEIGEVEAALLRHPGVRQAVVHPWIEAGEPRLTAYVVAEGEPGPGPAELRDFLRGRLPEPMHPTAWMALAALPLTPSGKVDRRALPPPPAPGQEADRSFVAPRTPTEELLAGIWADVLGLDRVGVEDDFASLGGHSLLATQVVSRMRGALGIELPLRRLLESPTVAELAAELEAWRREELPPPVAPVPREGDLPLSFAQQRLCFLDGLTPGNPVYNLPGAVRLSGALDVAALAGSVAAVVRRHEALRTTFDTAAGRSRQVIAPAGPVPLPLVDLRELPAAAREREAWRLVSDSARRPFDLAQGPLLRALLLRLEGAEHWFLLTLHHVVSDGWSQGIFIEELAGLYAANAAGRPDPLPPLPVQYADFAAWQRVWLSGPVLARQVDYWKRQLDGLPVLALPADRPRPEVSSHRGAVERVRLGKDLVDGAKALARREGSSLFMTLLAAFGVVLSYRSGAEDLAVGTDVANRNVRETERMIGFFVNQLVLRLDASGDPAGRELIARVRQVALDAYAHQDLPFEKLVETLAPARELNRTPLFQVKFVLQNAPRPPLAAAGLTLAPLEIDTGTAKFDLLWNLWEGEEGELSGALEYSMDLYERATAARLLALYERALRDLVARPEAPLSALKESLAAWERGQREAEEEAWMKSSLSRFKSVKPKKITAAGPASGESKEQAS